MIILIAFSTAVSLISFQKSFYSTNAQTTTPTNTSTLVRSLWTRSRKTLFKITREKAIRTSSTSRLCPIEQPPCGSRQQFKVSHSLTFHAERHQLLHKKDKKVRQESLRQIPRFLQKGYIRVQWRFIKLLPLLLNLRATTSALVLTHKITNPMWASSSEIWMQIWRRTLKNWRNAEIQPSWSQIPVT